MKKSIVATALLLATALPALQGCFPVVAAGVGVGALAVADRRSLGTQTTDEENEWKVGNRISGQFGSERVHVNVTSYNRRVLLTGEAASAADRDEIGRIAAGVVDVTNVSNEIQIGPVSAFSSRSNDAYITSKVKARFLDGNRFSPNFVKVVTESSVVYLLGIVTQAEASAAVDIARTTSGVKKVVNVTQIIGENEAKAIDTKQTENKDAPKQP